jgi:hypothetical protein
MSTKSSDFREYPYGFSSGVFSDSACETAVPATAALVISENR